MAVMEMVGPRSLGMQADWASASSTPEVRLSSEDLVFCSQWVRVGFDVGGNKGSWNMCCTFCGFWKLRGSHCHWEPNCTPGSPTRASPQQCPGLAGVFNVTRPALTDDWRDWLQLPDSLGQETRD